MDKEQRDARIKELEKQGFTGKTCPELDRLNREQTNELSDDELIELIQKRTAASKPVGKLVAAAQARGLRF